MLTEYLGRIKKETADMPNDEAMGVLERFMEGYHIHKEKHGSFKWLKGDEYVEKMKGRYEFMLEYALGKEGD